MTRITLDDRQRLDWLRLIRTESIGPRSFLALVNRYGGAGQALEAMPEIARSAGRTLRLCSVAEAERELEGARRLGARFVVAEGGHGAAATTSSDGGSADDGGDIGLADQGAHAASATTSAGGPAADTGDASAGQLSEEARKAGKQG